MQSHTANQELIVKYLLGSLPEAELEQFEARYLDDAVLFEELEEIEDELIDDYVCGKLTGAQQESFEQYFLQSAGRREKLEFARAITKHAVDWKKELKQGADDSGQDNVHEFSRSSRRVVDWWQWAAIAAVVLIAVALGIAWFRNRELQRELDAALAREAKSRESAQAEAARTTEVLAQLSAERQQTEKLEEQLAQLQNSITVDAARRVVVSALLGVEYLRRGTRGGAEPRLKIVQVPNNAKVLRLTVALETGRFENFRSVLTRSDGKTVWTRVGLKAHVAGSKQSLLLSIPAETVSSGNYELVVTGLNPGAAAELVGTYSLRVRR